MTAILTSDLCRVRPPAEPIPSALLGSAAATIFQHLVCMNNGVRHCLLKQAVRTTVESIDLAHVAVEGRKLARFLLDEPVSTETGGRLSHFAFNLPIYVIASLFGIPQEKLEQTALWLDLFVRCVAPASSHSHIERGKMASSHLLDLFRVLLCTSLAGSGGSLLALLAQQMKEIVCTDQ